MSKVVLIFKGRPVWLFVTGVLVALAAGMAISEWANGVRPLFDINDAAMIAILVALGGFVLNLYNRIGKLENDLQLFRSENSALRDDLRAATTFIDRVGIWLVAGMPPSKRLKPPAQLAEHIDAELWTDTAIGGTDA